MLEEDSGTEIHGGVACINAVFYAGTWIKDIAIPLVFPGLTRAVRGLLDKARGNSNTEFVLAVKG